MRVALNYQKGQRIVAWIEEETAYFVDFDRQIFSHLPVVPHCFISPTDFARHILYMYTNNQHGMPHIPHAHQYLTVIYQKGFERFLADPRVSLINV